MKQGIKNALKSVNQKSFFNEWSFFWSKSNLYLGDNDTDYHYGTK